jgi:DNA-binding GntR family transcriptional regulator
MLQSHALNKLTNELRTIANRGIEVAPIETEKVKDVFSIHRAIRSQMANGKLEG